jgi:hypothetical protein
MIRIACPLVVVCVLAVVSPVVAQEPSVGQQPALTTNQSSPSASALTPGADSSAGLALTPKLDYPVASAFTRKHERPHALVPLYASFATLQALDYASTTRALAGGNAREANPVMSGVVGNRAAFVAIKAGATAGVILAGEKMWKKHRVAAVVFVAALNGAVAAVVARNYRVR